MTLAHYYLTLYLQKGLRPSGLSPMERINFFGTGTPHEERLQLFVEAVQKLTSDFGTWNIAWGEVNRFQRLSGDIEQQFDDTKPSLAVGLASGNWGALASFGSRGVTNTKKIYGTYGNSFVAVVEFGEKIRAKSILAGGQSSDPASPHFTDQAQRYADVQFKDVAFEEDEVKQRAVQSYQPGKK
jgi:acyl-homoserine lactone acylase PvdQ